MRSTWIVQKFFFEKGTRGSLEKIFKLVKRGRLLNRSSSRCWCPTPPDSRRLTSKSQHLQSSSLLLHFVSTLQSIPRLLFEYSET